MEKHNNFKTNFSLSGYTSILIGVYFLVATFLIKKMLEGFLIDNHLMSLFSAEILELCILIIIFITLFLSSITIFINGRKKAKKLDYKLWNIATKKSFYKYIVCFTSIFLILTTLIYFNYLDYLTPAFLVLYAITLLLLKLTNSKNYLVLTSIALFLSVICFLIPMYWYSSLFILGIAHITYGLVVKN